MPGRGGAGEIWRKLQAAGLEFRLATTSFCPWQARAPRFDGWRAKPAPSRSDDATTKQRRQKLNGIQCFWRYGKICGTVKETKGHATHLARNDS